MKKIISFVLTLALLVSVFAILPLAAENRGENGYYVHLDQGITLVHRHGETEEPLSVAAKEIGDVKEFSCGCTNSVKNYLDGLLAVDKSTHTKALVDALLNYGAAAQNYFGYKTGALVGTPVEDTAALKAVTPAEPVINDDAGIYMGASLLLTGTIQLRFYFRGNDITATVGGKTADVEIGNGYSYVDVPVMPYDMEKAVTVTVDGTDTSVSYAPINYLKNKVNDPEISVMVASIYAYGVAAEEYRESASVEPDAESAALDILFDRNSWGQYYKHGVVKSVENDGESVTIGVTNNGDTDFAGTQLNKEAVGKMVSLGFRYLSFTVNCKTGSKGTTPAYLCAYYYSNSLKKDIPLDFLLDVPSVSYDHYYADGDEVSIDLFKLYDSLQDGEGLVLILTTRAAWDGCETGNGYITLSNIEFSEECNRNKVLLVSIDGLSGSLIEQTDFNILTYLSAYTLSAQTVNPSLTLPAHMSMTHGVTPTTHGVTKNDQVPTYSGNGIFETVSAAGLTSAMFYDWKELENLAKEDTLRVWRNYFCEIGSNKKQDFYASVDLLSNAAINHITNTPTDLTFLYYGLPDDTGENRGGWSSQNYIDAVNQVLGSLLNVVMVALENEYTIIITADHGGGGYNGDNKHGSTAPEDMYIPLFIMDPSLQSADLGDGVSILDVAPTVADLLGIEAETYWVGRSLVSDDSVAKREDMALDLFLSEDAWGNYDHGTIADTTEGEDSITMQLSGSGMTGLQLKKSAISEMISLGYRYLSFTVNYEKVSGGNTPTYADVYVWNNAADSYYDDFFVSEPDDRDPDYKMETYYANGREIIVDLWLLYYRLSDTNSSTNTNGLIFILSAGLYWQATKGGYITFSNVSLTTELD